MSSPLEWLAELERKATPGEWVVTSYSDGGEAVAYPAEVQR